MFNIVQKNKLTVLIFHKVPHVSNPLTPLETPLETFKNVLHFIKEQFRVIPLSDAVTALKAGNLPHRAACITFDDGYPDWVTGIAPLLESEGLPATFFITTGQLNGQAMWNERILHAVMRANDGHEGVELKASGLPHLPLMSQTDRVKAIEKLDSFLKYTAPAEREMYLQFLEDQMGARCSDVPVLTPAQVRNLHSRGFEIGGHSVTHPILSSCTPSRAFSEIAESKEELQGIINGRVEAFAYPNGIPGRDFGSEHIDMVKRAGYAHAVTTHHGVASPDGSFFQIPRFTPWGPSAGKMRVQFMRNYLVRNGALEETKQEGKRALMVAFHFPPQAGSSGILRTLNFVKNLPAQNWQPTVLTAQPQAYVEQRNDLVRSIPPSVRVERAFALDTAKHLAIKGKYLGTLALPDRWVSWWPFAVMKGMQEIRTNRPALIWSTYPISTAHLIGATLSRLSGIPWVADFRDPMVSENYPSTGLQRTLWKRLESYVLRHAAACIFTTERAAITYRQRYPMAQARCHVIENGYDEDAFNGVEPDRFGAPANKLLILHSGLIYPKDRNPSTFFSAINSLLQKKMIDRENLCIRFRAPYHDEEVLASAQQYGLQDVVEVAPPVPYQRAIAEMLGADLLVVFQGSSFNAQIPAKIYEYLRAARPVFAVVDPAGDTAAILRQFPGAYVADIASEMNIATNLEVALADLRGDRQSAALQRNVDQVRRYSRKEQTMRLVTYLNAVLPQPENDTENCRGNTE
ncbi:polysaccharide deacetylase family protein [Diaphorobacter limosus]|uniref:Polysaccharide deacetylase family protein n=1 Tax=Diaphorobacter limosus TaxID=3036128 RepID=A0ABZ0J108_9BURK|nr:polysaccharide deacetylase family protein [Diaphorobacter sp. Y-1]WOO31932.1 polysaccharide deacetylase family protein [Diaphorobacter sp. Y-1]